jgi:hypothetical protein
MNKNEGIPDAVAYQYCEHPAERILVASLSRRSRIGGLPSTFLARCSATCRERRLTSRRPNIFRIYTTEQVRYYNAGNKEITKDSTLFPNY